MAVALQRERGGGPCAVALCPSVHACCRPPCPHHWPTSHAGALVDRAGTPGKGQRSHGQEP